MNVTIVRNFLRFKKDGESTFEGERTEYRFTSLERPSGYDLVLTEMTVWGRASPRHTWKVEKVIFDRYDRRRQSDTSLDEPSLSLDIIAAAEAEARSAINFKTWKDSRR